MTREFRISRREDMILAVESVSNGSKMEIFFKKGFAGNLDVFHRKSPPSLSFSMKEVVPLVFTGNPSKSFIISVGGEFDREWFVDLLGPVTERLIVSKQDFFAAFGGGIPFVRRFVFVRGRRIK